MPPPRSRVPQAPAARAGGAPGGAGSPWSCRCHSRARSSNRRRPSSFHGPGPWPRDRVPGVRPARSPRSGRTLRSGTAGTGRNPGKNPRGPSPTTRTTGLLRVCTWSMPCVMPASSPARRPRPRPRSPRGSSRSRLRSPLLDASHDLLRSRLHRRWRRDMNRS
jgi:hypothetical protein